MAGRADGGGKRDALKIVGDMGESFDGGHELDAGPVADDRVHLVENQRFDVRQR